MSHHLLSRASRGMHRDTGALSPYLEALATTLRHHQYAASTIQRHLQEACAFGRWFTVQCSQLSDVSERMLDRYLSARAPLKRRRQQKISVAVHFLFEQLREAGVIAAPSARGVPKTQLHQCVAQYQTYLADVLGLAPTTQQQYLRFATRLLTTLSLRGGELKWTAFTADAITKFVQADASLRKGFGPYSTVTAVRSFLRFLVAQGKLPAGLDRAIPTIRRWTHAALPQHLSDSDITRLLQCCRDGTSIGTRNHTVLLLLSRLALRAKEVARLQLTDVDWRNGTVLIRSSKTHTERLLPLAQDIGEALLTYLRTARPLSSSRDLFLEHTAPYLSLQTASAITKIVKRLLAKAGIARPSSGAHLFRHTAATQMVNRGVSFKEIADVLGHQTLQTTGIYAKLDLTALGAVALPWPGGAQ